MITAQTYLDPGVEHGELEGRQQERDTQRHEPLPDAEEDEAQHHDHQGRGRGYLAPAHGVGAPIGFLPDKWPTKMCVCVCVYLLNCT